MGRWFSLCVAVTILAGCSNSSWQNIRGTKYGRVTGKVTYIDGKRLAAGRIFFRKEGSKLSKDYKVAEIEPDGTYAIDALIGTCEVYLDTNYILELEGIGGLPQEDQERLITLRKAYRPLPPEYKDPDKTPLKIDVRLGRQSFDIELKGTPEAPPKMPDAPPGK